MFHQNKPAETGETALPTEHIEQATQAAEDVEQRAEQLQQDLQKLP